MCGIIGIVGCASKNIVDDLLEGLHRLEYRGYDSAGLAVLEKHSSNENSEDSTITRRREKGKLKNLKNNLQKNPLTSHIGIGHTRWATHGIPNEENAHPHMTGNVALVHNGIIENYRELYRHLKAQNSNLQLESETDTEILVHLLDFELQKGQHPKQAVANILPLLKGAFAFVALFKDHPTLLIGARRGSPLVIGHGGYDDSDNGEIFFGSDALALAHLTNQITYLDEGDWAVISQNGDEACADIYDKNNEQVQREKILSAASGAMVGKGNYRHFMLKEIYEQPTVIGDTLSTFLNPASRAISLPPLKCDLKSLESVFIVACGTAFYAGMVAKYWLEKIARLPCEIDIASEFRYRAPPMRKGSLTICISQSGETMDSLKALEYAKGQGMHILSVVNVGTSSIARESHDVLLTQAGPEIGVASTKAFTTQLTLLASIAVACAKARGAITVDEATNYAKSLSLIPALIGKVIDEEAKIEKIAQSILAESRDVLYIGRGYLYPIALEGALKLKELSYIHAEGYAAGEMKHGPIALVEENLPIIVLAPRDDLFEKTLSNIQESAARGGRIIAISDAEGLKEITEKCGPVSTILMPECDSFTSPILYSIPIQLLAYHTALAKGTDVDQPRNLAKSVTVE